MVQLNPLLLMTCPALFTVHLQLTKQNVGTSCSVLLLLVLQVDQKSEAVLLPVYGVLVPFHILCIKNVSSSQVGAFGDDNIQANSSEVTRAACLQ
jgi:hypothetical protein